MEWTVAVALSAVVLACGGYGGWALWPKKPPKCEPGLAYVKRECVGVTAKAFPVDDPAMEKLLQKIEEQNDWAAEQWEEESTPYVRIALMMPFAGSDKSSMTALMARRAVAGALAAQQEINKWSPELKYQMLLAPNGKDLDKWPHVTSRLPELAADTEKPLVGVTGISSSTSNSLEAVRKLSDLRIPTVSPVTTSTKMREEYLFKTPPSNEQLAEALDEYLEHRAGGAKHPEKHGFLVWDDKNPDIYASDLKRVFEEKFSDYGLADDNNAPFQGGSVNAEEEGYKRDFTGAVRGICGGDFDTVFFAGRDQDLPFLIREIAEKSDCRDDRELRILKVGIGLESTLTEPETLSDLKTANAIVVDAASVSPLWWQKGNQAPPGSRALPRRIGKLNRHGNLGERPLDDGNAAMYYDAFKFLAEATEQKFQNNRTKKDDPVLPTKGDVDQALRTSPLNRKDCPDCFQGASGTYGFKSGAHDKWAVCKPVPVIEYRPDSSGDGRVSATDPRYRTYQEDDGVDCPPE